MRRGRSTRSPRPGPGPRPRFQQDEPNSYRQHSNFGPFPGPGPSQRPPFQSKKPAFGQFGQGMRFETPVRGLLGGPMPTNAFPKRSFSHGNNYERQDRPYNYERQDRPYNYERQVWHFENRNNPLQVDYNRNMQGSRISLRSNRSERSGLEQQIELPGLPPRYHCPKCEGVYDFTNVANKYTGKVPVILSCNHTVCQECVYQGLKNNKFICPTCKLESTANEEERPKQQSDVQKSFPINMYIFGYVTMNKPQSAILRTEESVSFVAASKAKKNSAQVADADRCCILTCLKLATMFCPSCEVIYCTDCCESVHESIKNLINHEPVPRTTQKFSLNLEACPDHPTMKTEFLCKICDVTGCCYCFLDHRSDHERIALHSLNDCEKEEFKKLKQNAKEKLRKLHSAKKKILKISNFDTGSIKKKVHTFFADYHAQIEKMEQMCCDQLDGPLMGNRDVEKVQAIVESSAEQLKLLLTVNEDSSDKSLNLRGAYKKLKTVDRLPTYLLSNTGESEPVRLVIDQSIMNKIRDCIKIHVDEESVYRLVTEEELPEGYVIKDESSDEFEVDDQLLLETVSVASETNVISKTSPPKSVRPKSRAHDMMKKIEVKHINSMDSFFVHFKSELAELERLEEDITSYVKMGGPEKVALPQINQGYLVQYNDDSTKTKTTKWCRGEIKEIKNGETGAMYDVFLMDFGKTQLMDGNRIKDIPDYLYRRKPFAVECSLENRCQVVWNDKAHTTLAKILNGKEVFVSVLRKNPDDGVLVVDLLVASSDGKATSVYDILIHCRNSVEASRSNENQPLAVTAPRNILSVKVFPNSKSFQKNQSERVIIATVIDPDSLFVHMAQYRPDFETMCRAMKKAYKSSHSAGVMPIEGTYVMVEYKDPVRSNWHRAVVRKTDILNDKVNVLLVDWGFSATVPVNCVKPLQENFTKLDSQAVCVKMADILPYGKKGCWSPGSIEYLNQYQKSKEVLKMTIIDTNPEVVALFEISNNFDKCINAFMVENNLADSIGPVSRRLKWDRECAEKPKITETSDCPFVSSLLKGEDEAEFEDNLDDVKIRRVEIVRFDNPGRMWIKYMDSQELENDLYRKLQVHFSQNAINKDEWKVGEVCVTEHGSFYHRAEIVGCVGGLYKLLLTDEMEEIFVPLNKLYQCPKYFQQFKKISNKCHLAYLKPAGGTDKWSASLIDCVKDIFKVQKRFYVAEVEDSPSNDDQESMAVNMWYGVVVQGDAFTQDKVRYISINRRLIHTGMCTKAKTTENVKKATNGEDLLKSILGITSLEEPVEKTSESSEAASENTNIDVASISNSKIPDVTYKRKISVLMGKSSSGSKKSDCSESDGTSDAEKVEEKVKSPAPKKSSRSPAKVTETSPSKDETESQNVNINGGITSWNDLMKNEQNNANIDEVQKSKSQESPYRRIECEIVDWKPASRFTEREFQGRITCVEIGGKLYLHSEQVDGIYNDLEKNINEYFNNNPPQIVNHSWEPGQLCTIKWDNGNWYRGTILKVKSPEIIQVLMVDFGSDHDVSPKNLFREVLYTDVPCFATRAKLDRIYAKSGSWLTSDYDRFFGLTTDWCKIVVVGALEVELPSVEVYNEHGEFINERLVELCPNLSRCSYFPTTTDDDDDDEVLSIEEVDDIQPVEVIQEIMGDILGDVVLVEGATEFKKRRLPAELLNGEMLLMEIGGLIDYNLVALRLPCEMLCPEVLTLTEGVQNCVEDFPHLTDIAVGVPCWAPYAADNIWYRARVSNISTLALGHVEVFFVDYGNSESVSVENVRKIRPEHMKYPQQAWEARINVDRDFKVEDVGVMRVMSSLDRKHKFIKLIKEDPFIVDIYDHNGNLSYKNLLNCGVLRPFML